MASGPSPAIELAVEQDVAGRGFGETGDGAQRGRFAGAVGAEQRHHLALFDRDRHAAQSLDLAVADHQIADFEQRHHSAPR